MDKNLIQRIVTGIIFIVVLVCAIWFSVWTMAGLFLLIVILGLWEFYGLAEKAGAHPQKYFGVIVGSSMIAVVFLSKSYLLYLAYLIHPLIFFPFFIELFRKKENPFSNIGWTILGWLYVVLPFGLLVLNFVPFLFLKNESSIFQQHVYNPRPLLCIFILIWMGDTMAYVCGRLFGKHKLFERISPKKTWEGFIGGLVFTIVAGGFLGKWFFADPGNFNQEIKWMCIGATLAIFGMLGDLVESLLKRSVGVKDSGNLLPGHGGILDRFDGLLLAYPFASAVFLICDALLGTH